MGKPATTTSCSGALLSCSQQEKEKNAIHSAEKNINIVQGIFHIVIILSGIIQLTPLKLKFRFYRFPFFESLSVISFYCTQKIK